VNGVERERERTQGAGERERADGSEGWRTAEEREGVRRAERGGEGDSGARLRENRACLISAKNVIK